MEMVIESTDLIWHFVAQWFGTLHHVPSDSLRTEPAPATTNSTQEPTAEELSVEHYHEAARGPFTVPAIKVPQRPQSARLSSNITPWRRGGWRVLENGEVYLRKAVVVKDPPGSYGDMEPRPPYFEFLREKDPWWSGWLKFGQLLLHLASYFSCLIDAKNWKEVAVSVQGASRILLFIQLVNSRLDPFIAHASQSHDVCKNENNRNG